MEGGGGGGANLVVDSDLVDGLPGEGWHPLAVTCACGNARREKVESRLVWWSRQKGMPDVNHIGCTGQP
jgi:hypothetical protein